MGCRWIAAGGLAVTLFASRGAAQDGVEAEYRAAIDGAIVHFDAGRWAEARELFARAHALVPNARTLRGIGVTSFELGDYAEAYRALTAASAATERPLTDAQLAEVDGLIARARPHVGVIRVERPEGEPVTLDGTVVEGGVLVLARGDHELACLGVTRALHVVGGEEELIRFERPPPPSEPDDAWTVELLPIERALPVEPAPPPRGRTEPAIPIALFASGGALAVVAFATGAAWWAHEDGELSACESAGARCLNEGDVRAALEGSIGTTLALGALGFGALVAAIVTLATHLAGEEESRALRCVPGAGGATCAASF